MSQPTANELTPYSPTPEKDQDITPEQLLATLQEHFGEQARDLLDRSAAIITAQRYVRRVLDVIDVRTTMAQYPLGTWGSFSRNSLGRLDAIRLNLTDKTSGLPYHLEMSNHEPTEDEPNPRITISITQCEPQESYRRFERMNPANDPGLYRNLTAAALLHGTPQCLSAGNIDQTLQVIKNLTDHAAKVTQP